MSREQMKNSNIGEGAVGILACHCGRYFASVNQQKLVEQMSLCKELTRAFRSVFR